MPEFRSTGNGSAATLAGGARKAAARPGNAAA